MLFKFFMQVKSHLCRGQMRYKGMLTLQNAFGKHLLFTNTWTSGVLMAIGDICEQEIEFQRKILSTRYDWGRIGRMFLTGLLFGPVHHYFYAWMDKRIPHRSVKFVTQKILLDQIIMSPVCIVLFFYSMGALEGRPSKETTVEMKEKFIPIYVVDWSIWPPTQFINFYYLPVKYQVLYINAVTMVYNVYLSFMKHKNMPLEIIEA